MKIYAKQVSPEWQESPLFIEGCFPDNIAVCGNRDFKEHKPEIFGKVKTTLEQGELAEVLENIKEWKDYYSNVTQAINEYLPSVKGRYSTNAIHALKRLVSEYSTCSRNEEDTLLCRVLSLVTGKEWDYRTIRGSSQSDWNEVYFPVDEWSMEALHTFESEYFNEGTEWIVHEGDNTPEISNDIEGYTIYCTSWNVEGIREEIAEMTGESPGNIIMYAFDGYIRTPQYKKV